MYEISRWVEPSEEMPVGANFIIGLDLGQSQDYSAIAIVERLGGSGGIGAQYHVRKLERTRGTPYPQIVTRVKSVLLQLRGAEIIIDATGVGRPVVDMFEQAGMRPVAVHIHAGAKVTKDESKQAAARARGWVPGACRDYGVPKADLVATLQVLLQNRRLRVAEGPLSDVLAAEMLNFRVKINPDTAHESFSAWREADHDDLVLAVALACWWAENKPKLPIVPKI